MNRKLLILIIATSIVCPAMGAKVESFCEYGTGVALKLGAGGALWDQLWGLGPCDWYECQASPNVGILNENVKGVLETTTSGTPAIDSDLILRLPFGGSLDLTAYDGTNSNKVVGQIKGIIAADPENNQYDGLFVADLNASRAVVDEEAGTITVNFGAAMTTVPAAAGALVTITETTGKFKSVKAVGKWELQVSGTLIVKRVPKLDLQTNIFAALVNSTLLLGASEEIVLTGSYYRTSPNN